MKGPGAASRAAVAVMAALAMAGAVLGASAGAADTPAGDMVRIAAGRYRPLYRDPAGRRSGDAQRAKGVSVPAFAIDRRPVTNAAFLGFVLRHPEWRRARVSRLFADTSYLRHWAGPADLGRSAPPASPVVHVSWFAARAYCEATGRRLPTVAEWEMVAAADETRRDASRDPRFLERIRTWYGRPTPDILPAVGGGFRNLWGVEDLHGSVWEWTLDFSSALVSGESRGDAALERNLYCGSGASYASDFADYAAFMRYAYRSSLQARYATGNLGFRCARDVPAHGGTTQ